MSATPTPRVDTTVLRDEIAADLRHDTPGPEHGLREAFLYERRLRLAHEVGQLPGRQFDALAAAVSKAGGEAIDNGTANYRNDTCADIVHKAVAGAVADTENERPLEVGQFLSVVWRIAATS